MFSFVPPIPESRRQLSVSTRTGNVFPAVEQHLRMSAISPLSCDSDRHDLPFGRDRFQLDMFHEQVPLPVPCYDLLPVTDFTVARHEGEFRAPPAPLS